MKLYFAPDTCSLSPHIVLQEMGLPYDLVRVNNRTKRTSDGADFLSINPKGYVAALVLDGGEVLTEGPAILQYLADLEPSSGLAPPTGTLDRVRLQEWLNFITAEIHAAPGLLFDQTLPDSVQDTVKARLSRRLAIVDSRLSKHLYLMSEVSPSRTPICSRFWAGCRPSRSRSTGGPPSPPTSSGSGHAPP